MRHLLLITSLIFVSPIQALDYPDTPREETVNTYHEVQVKDPYQWLEDWSSEDVKAWSARQNAVAREFLDKLPNRDALQHQPIDCRDVCRAWRVMAHTGKQRARDHSAETRETNCPRQSCFHWQHVSLGRTIRT